MFDPLSHMLNLIRAIKIDFDINLLYNSLLQNIHYLTHFESE